jgi:acetyltransferase-like isoleucine patch superfamily enzyme
MAGAHISADATVAPGAQLGDEVVVEARAVIHDGTRVGDRTVIGAGSVVHRGVELGVACTIENLVVLGKRPRLRPGSSAAGGAELGPLVIGDGVTVCCGAVVYAGSQLAARVIIGDQAQVRERSRIGPGSVVGRASAVDFDVQVGANVLIQTGVYVTGHSVVEDDVFLGPGVLTTNDHSMGRHPPGAPIRGAVFRRACRVGGGVVVLPGVVIGAEAFIAAGAIVTRDVPPREVALGTPARRLREVPDEDLIERWR